MDKISVFQPVKNCYARGKGKERCVYCGHGNYKEENEDSMHYGKCVYKNLVDKIGNKKIMLIEFSEDK